MIQVFFVPEIRRQLMKKNGKEKKYISIPQLGYLFFCVVTMQAYWIRPVYAVTVWEKASEIMKDVYKQIIGISTIAAIVTAAIALLLMNFSRSGRTVDESRAWLKRKIGRASCRERV